MTYEPDHLTYVFVAGLWNNEYEERLIFRGRPLFPGLISRLALLVYLHSVLENCDCNQPLSLMQFALKRSCPLFPVPCTCWHVHRDRWLHFIRLVGMSRQIWSHKPAMT